MRGIAAHFQKTLSDPTPGPGLNNPGNAGSENHIDAELDEKIHAGEGYNDVIQHRCTVCKALERGEEEHHHTQNKKAGVYNGANDARGDDGCKPALLLNGLVDKPGKPTGHRGFYKADEDGSEGVLRHEQLNKAAVQSEQAENKHHKS